MNNTPDPVTAPNTGFHSPGIDPQALSDDLFDYHGYQVVRREFFAHTQEPALCFCRYQLYVNAACLKKLPTVDHVQVLVNQDTKKLVIRPCGEDEKDSFSWRSQSKTKSRPKRITCRIFYAKIMDLMGWDPESAPTTRSSCYLISLRRRFSRARIQRLGHTGQAGSRRFHPNGNLNLVYPSRPTAGLCRSTCFKGMRYSVYALLPGRRPPSCPLLKRMDQRIFG